MVSLSRIKPISYFKANVAEIIRDLAEMHEPMIITRNGEATAVMQDVASYQATQETLALLNCWRSAMPICRRCCVSVISQVNSNSAVPAGVS